MAKITFDFFHNFGIATREDVSDLLYFEKVAIIHDELSGFKNFISNLKEEFISFIAVTELDLGSDIPKSLTRAAIRKWITDTNFITFCHSSDIKYDEKQFLEAIASGELNVFDTYKAYNHLINACKDEIRTIAVTLSMKDKDPKNQGYEYRLLCVTYDEGKDLYINLKVLNTELKDLAIKQALASFYTHIEKTVVRKLEFKLQRVGLADYSQEYYIKKYMAAVILLDKLRKSDKVKECLAIEGFSRADKSIKDHLANIFLFASVSQFVKAVNEITG